MKKALDTDQEARDIERAYYEHCLLRDNGSKRELLLKLIEGTRMVHNRYIVEADTFARLVKIADQLQGGNDRERDVGHRLWLITNEIRELPIKDEPNAPSV